MILNQFKLKNLKLNNRIVMPPMCMYIADENGMANTFHEIHYATRAVGSVGLIIQESTAILPNGRISTQDLGIWSDDHLFGLTNIVTKVHELGSKIGIQLNHAGRKARLEDKWAPSPIAFYDNEIPHEMTFEEIKKVINSFSEAAYRANIIGYDLIEIHCAHGYLINQFLSPLTNKRTDVYKNGTQFLKEIIEAIKSVWPEDKALGIRISATEYHEEGLDVDDWLDILKPYHNILDFVDVSTGGNIKADIKLFPGYQLSYAKILKQKTPFLIIGGGLIDDLTFGNRAIVDNMCDMVYYGRKLLREPYFILNEANKLGINYPWPKSYIRGKK